MNGPDITEQSYTACFVTLSEVQSRIPGFLNVQKCADFFRIVKNKHWQKIWESCIWGTVSYMHKCLLFSRKGIWGVIPFALNPFLSLKAYDYFCNLTYICFLQWLTIEGEGVFGVTTNLLYSLHPTHSLIMSLHKAATTLIEKYKYDVTYTSLWYSLENISGNP